CRHRRRRQARDQNRDCDAAHATAPFVIANHIRHPTTRIEHTSVAPGAGRGTSRETGKDGSRAMTGGQERGETLCLVHGARPDDACWELLADELERRGHRCVVPVLPLDNRGARFEDYAAVVARSLRSCGPAILVGHSLSSAVIALVPTTMPVKSLVYLCPAM